MPTTVVLQEVEDGLHVHFPSPCKSDCYIKSMKKGFDLDCNSICFLATHQQSDKSLEKFDSDQKLFNDIVKMRHETKENHHLILPNPELNDF